MKELIERSECIQVSYLKIWFIYIDLKIVSYYLQRYSYHSFVLIVVTILSTVCDNPPKQYQNNLLSIDSYITFVLTPFRSELLRGGGGGGDKNSRGSVCPTNLFFCTLSRASSSLGHSQVFTLVQCMYAHMCM